MAVRVAHQGTKPAPVVPGFRPLPRPIVPPGGGFRPSMPMGNLWKTAMMARMLNDDGMMLFD